MVNTGLYLNAFFPIFLMILDFCKHLRFEFQRTEWNFYHWTRKLNILEVPNQRNYSSKSIPFIENPSSIHVIRRFRFMHEPIHVQDKWSNETNLTGRFAQRSLLPEKLPEKLPAQPDMVRGYREFIKQNNVLFKGPFQTERNKNNTKRRTWWIHKLEKIANTKF